VFSGLMQGVESELQEQFKAARSLACEHTAAPRASIGIRIGVALIAVANGRNALDGLL
jgi:hypothetical protein